MNIAMTSPDLGGLQNQTNQYRCSEAAPARKLPRYMVGAGVRGIPPSISSMA
jgi:hypothetical protein